MQTRPVIIPCTAPMTEGLLKKMTSSHVHTKRLVAAQMLVLRTAMDESVLAAYGSPPLKPAHPIHSNPDPANVSTTLFGGNLSLSFFTLGPTWNSINVCYPINNYIIFWFRLYLFYFESKLILKCMSHFQLEKKNRLLYPWKWPQRTKHNDVWAKIMIFKSLSKSNLLISINN